jgi:hypothetical protein
MSKKHQIVVLMIEIRFIQLRRLNKNELFCL